MHCHGHDRANAADFAGGHDRDKVAAG